MTPPWSGRALSRPVLKKSYLAKAELRGLMEGMLTSRQPPNGPTRFSEWLETHKNEIGAFYSSELGRHFRWRPGA